MCTVPKKLIRNSVSFYKICCHEIIWISSDPSVLSLLQNKSPSHNISKNCIIDFTIIAVLHNDSSELRGITNTSKFAILFEYKNPFTYLIFYIPWGHFFLTMVHIWIILVLCKQQNFDCLTEKYFLSYAAKSAGEEKADCENTQYKRTVGSSPFSSNRVKKRAAYIYLEKL